MKQAFEDVRGVVAELPGGAAEAELTIAAGVVTPTGAIHTVDTEGDAATDDLTTLALTNHPEGRLLLLSPANAARAVVVKHAAGGDGQVYLAGAADLTMDDTGISLLLKRVGTAWYEVSVASVGGRRAPSFDNPYGFYKRESGSVVFAKTGASTLSIKAGTEILVAGTRVKITADTAVVMPALTAGTDYAIYACTDGTVRADASFTAPTGYTTETSRLIGGFHYGLVAPGTTVAGGSFATTGNGMIWTQADVDAIAGINAFSLWDLKWRPLCDPQGMALVAGRIWVDIYFCGTNHTTNGTSKAGTDIASGTVLPKKPLEFGGDGTITYATPRWWEFVEIANAYKKRLLCEQEFILAAFGVTENQSIDTTAATYPTTQRNAGYTSKYGIEQASGHHYIWGEDAGQYYDTTEWTWKDVNGGRGQIITQGTYGLARVLLGGFRTDGANSGSRCANWVNYPWTSHWGVGLRAACDHLRAV